MTSIQRVFPPEQFAVVGRPITFTCYSKIPVNWTFNEQELPANVELSQGDQRLQYKLKIRHVDLFNTGVYTCHGLYNNNLFESSATLEVKCK